MFESLQGRILKRMDMDWGCGKLVINEKAARLKWLRGLGVIRVDEGDIRAMCESVQSDRGPVVDGGWCEGVYRLARGSSAWLLGRVVLQVSF